MSNIQKTLDALQPYCIGIRYLEGSVLVDAVFKDGWAIPEDPKIKKIKGNEELNYYMIYSDIKGVGLDDLLAYVDKTIKLNQEREKKHDLLKQMVNELKEVFKRNSLTKLTRLKFVFGDEELLPKFDEFEVDDIPEIAEEPIDEPTEETPPVNTEEQAVQYLDENKQPIELTEYDREVLEEEARAERNRSILNSKKPKNLTPVKVELPPKRKVEKPATASFATCECGPDEACEKCIDEKGL